MNNITDRQQCNLGRLKRDSGFFQLWNPTTKIVYAKNSKLYFVVFESAFNDIRIVCKCTIQLRLLKMTKSRISNPTIKIL